MEDKNPFKKLGQPPKEVPETLKKKVMDDINTFKLFADMGRLFSFNYSEVIASFFKKRENKGNI